MATMTAPGEVEREMEATMGEALLALQRDRPQLRADKDGVHSKYVSLDALLTTVLPMLHRHGIVLTQHPTHVDGQPALYTRLLHTPSGEREEATMLLMSAKEDPQAQGSAITYARRYALVTALGLSTDDDDDGARASASRSGSDRVTGQRGSTGRDYEIKDNQRAVIWGKARGADIENELLYRIIRCTTKGKVEHPDAVRTRAQLDFVIAAIEKYQADTEAALSGIESWEAEQGITGKPAGEKPTAEPELPAGPSPLDSSPSASDDEIPF